MQYTVIFILKIFMNWDNLSKKKVLIKTHMLKLSAFMTSLFQGYIFYAIECFFRMQYDRTTNNVIITLSI